MQIPLFKRLHLDLEPFFLKHLALQVLLEVQDLLAMHLLLDLLLLLQLVDPDLHLYHLLPLAVLALVDHHFEVVGSLSIFLGA